MKRPIKLPIIKHRNYDVPKAGNVTEIITDDYPIVTKYLVETRNIKISDIEIHGDHPCGEDVIFINGKYAGYVDTYLFDEINNHYKTNIIFY